MSEIFRPPSLLLIVPTLNSFPLLSNLLSSLQSQDWSSWKVLFVDGPSSLEHKQWLDSICANESRCSWVEQRLGETGIFGAMNQGLLSACPSSWILFWGSDDWAATPGVLSELMEVVEYVEMSPSECPDLLICRGRYVDIKSGVLGRSTFFCSSGVLDAAAYRRALLSGRTPPHQATLFGPGARRRLNRFASGFRLSADLDYFLRLSRSSDLRVQCVDLELVFMGDGGVSGQQTLRRLIEVCRAYRQTFGCRWLLSFTMRYFRRLASQLERSK